MKIQAQFRKIFRRNLPPEKLAWGLAIGIFCGIFFPYGAQLITALFFAWIFRVDKILAGIGTFLNNPFTGLPIYIVSWNIGCWIFGRSPHSWNPRSFLQKSDGHFWHNLFNFGDQVLLPMIFGLFLLGLIMGFIFYFLALYWIRFVHLERKLKILNRLSKQKKMAIILIFSCFVWI